MPRQTAKPFAISELDYELPPALIAQHPPARREDARLLIVDRTRQTLTDARITDLPDYLRPSDLLVLNDTRVLPARFTARRKTGGVIPGLFVEEESPSVWRVLLESSRRLKVGETIDLGGPEANPVEAELLERGEQGSWRLRLLVPGSAAEILQRIGRTPLPPYIRRKEGVPENTEVDRTRYQTVYAKKAGAIAAPTAGLHLTRDMLADLTARGIDTAFVTLHVGVGTFKPIGVDDLSRHVMHEERYALSADAAEAINRGRHRGGRIVAVGTTSLRVLETVMAGAEPVAPLRACEGATNLFVYPPWRFQGTDALLTNFHLPRSTLLALVMAFAGVDLTRRAYHHAIEREYRFYSFGDAMLIHG